MIVECVQFRLISNCNGVVVDLPDMYKVMTYMLHHRCSTRMPFLIWDRITDKFTGVKAKKSNLPFTAVTAFSKSASSAKVKRPEGMKTGPRFFILPQAGDRHDEADSLESVEKSMKDLRVFHPEISNFFIYDRFLNSLFRAEIIENKISYTSEGIDYQENKD